MEHSGIAALRPGGQTPELTVRVIRCWKPPFRDNEVCYVFVDKEGIGIQAMARGRDQRLVFSKLIVQGCYKIHGYACTEPDKYTSTLIHPAHMRIGSASVFTPIVDSPDLPREYFEFFTRQRLESSHAKMTESNQPQSRVILDYIGILQKMEDNITNNGKMYVAITLRDCSNRDVTIRLWEEIATSSTQFPRASVESSAQPAILALTALRLTDFMGKLQLQSTNATHVYVNPSTPETRTLLSLYERLSTERDSSETSGSISSASEPSQKTNSNVSELQAKDPTELKGNIFTIKAAVSEIHTDKEWHNIGCANCVQGLLQTGDTWFCSSHGTITSPTEIYRINATISDDTGSIPVLIFNKPSTKLAGMTCEDMLQTEDPNSNLHKIINREAIFHIQANKNNRAAIMHCTVIKVDMIAECISITRTPAPTTPKAFQSLHRSEPSTSTKRPLFQKEGPTAGKRTKED